MCFECLSIWQWFEKTQTFENEFQAAKCYCYLLHVNYKMPFTFVKRVMSCTCILHVRSIDMCSVSLQSGITNYWPGLVFVDLCDSWSLIVLTTLLSLHKSFQKREGQTFTCLVHCCHINIPYNIPYRCNLGFVEAYLHLVTEYIVTNLSWDTLSVIYGHHRAVV